MRSGPIRVAAIEVSHWHSLWDAAYLTMLAAMPDVTIIGVQDPNADVAANRAAVLGNPPLFTDYRAMLAETRPDFVVLTGVSASDNYNAFITSNWFSYWGVSPIWTWLPGGVDPSWTIIYPWFNAGAIVTFQRSTLIVTIVPTNAGPVVNPLLAQKEIRAVWAGVATSLLGQDNITQANVQNAINIMFQQSPYLVNSAP